MGFICHTHRASPCVIKLSPFRAVDPGDTCYQDYASKGLVDFYIGITYTKHDARLMKVTLRKSKNECKTADCLRSEATWRQKKVNIKKAWNESLCNQHESISEMLEFRILILAGH
jgi:hypothetical protein